MTRQRNKIKKDWDFELFYKSPKDPAIEKDIATAEQMVKRFVAKYDTKQKIFLSNTKVLFQALTDYNIILSSRYVRPWMYFTFRTHIDSRDEYAQAQISLMSLRLASISNNVTFFTVLLGALPEIQKQKFLKEKSLARFVHFLNVTFKQGRHLLSVPEEKILNLKNIPANQAWIQSIEKQLSLTTLMWNKKPMPLAEAHNFVHQITDRTDRNKLGKLLNECLAALAPYAEAELNAIFTNKKIDDELRGFKKAYEGTVLEYQNDPEVIENLVSTVTTNFAIAHRFYRIKAKMMKLKKLGYLDRMISAGKVQTTFSLEKSYQILRNAFSSVDSKYSSMLDAYMLNGQIDVLPKAGKLGGAYCWGSFGNPTFVLLNHTNDLKSLTTFGHEMGHAFHTELTKLQPAIYSQYSTSIAETASTLFQAITFDAVFDKLNDKEKIFALHDKINDSISTIFRQIACFNFEKDLHYKIREKGFLSKDDIAALHNSNMQAYLGPAVKMEKEDGYFFVSWGHIRRFFYVYTYAYGQLVSSALLRRYRKDRLYLKSIESILSAGGSDTPENILRKAGIDLSSPKFFEEGLLAINEDIDRLEKLLKVK